MDENIILNYDDNQTLQYFNDQKIEKNDIQFVEINISQNDTKYTGKIVKNVFDFLTTNVNLVLNFNE